MGPPDRRNPHWRDAGSGYYGEKTEATNLKKDFSTTSARLPFRTPWLRITARSLTVAQQPCPLTKQLAVSALVAEIREALR